MECWSQPSFEEWTYWFLRLQEKLYTHWLKQPQESTGVMEVNCGGLRLDLRQMACNEAWNLCPLANRTRTHLREGAKLAGCLQLGDKIWCPVGFRGWEDQTPDCGSHHHPKRCICSPSDITRQRPSLTASFPKASRPSRGSIYLRYNQANWNLTWQDKVWTVSQAAFCDLVQFLNVS